VKIVSPKADLHFPGARCVSSCQPGCVRLGPEGRDRLDRPAPAAARIPSNAAGRHGARPGRPRPALATPPTGLAHLAGEAGLSIATAYRYLHEALDVIVTHAPGRNDVLDRAHATGLPFVCLDGTLIPTDRVAARAERGYHL
jgi:hypothetical protein